MYNVWMLANAAGGYIGKVVREQILSVFIKEFFPFFFSPFIFIVCTREDGCWLNVLQ